ncbi:MAG TPA: hypothetical protein VMT62_11815 [Syntrophorhabdaceae bacterium]|nr:hypothetical protein [Syntrophorhabdaceae bacterium]
MVVIVLTIAAIAVALYAVEDFFRKSWKNDDVKAHRLDQIVVILFAIFLLLLAAVIKFTWYSK